MPNPRPHIGRSIRLIAPVAALWVCAAGVMRPASAQFEKPIIIRGPETPQRAVNPPSEERPIWADLDLLIDPLDPSAGEIREVPENILRSFVNEWTRQEYARAEELARQLIALTPDRPFGYYNLACALVRLDRVDEAIDALEKAVEHGWRNQYQFTYDLDLRALHTHGRYLALKAKLETLIRAEAMTPRPLRTDDWQAAARDLELAAPELLKKHHVAGASVALVHDGKVVWTSGFGVSDRRMNEPIRAQTRFKVEAPTHLFTAIAALQLEQQGVWSLDDPLAKWLPVIGKIGPDVNPRLTIRRALNHTAGLRPRYDQLELTDGADEEIRKRLRFDASLPEDEPFYCEEAYLAVGRAIERALGQGDEGSIDPSAVQAPTFSQLVRGRLIKPLLMDDTTFNRPAKPFGGHAVGHSILGTPFKDALTPTAPADPVYTTAEDLGKLIAFLAGGLDGIERAPLDGSERMRLFEDANNLGYGLGVRVRTTEYGRCVEMRDSDRGQGVLMRWYPEAKIGLVVLYNADGGAPLADHLAQLALGGE